MFMEDGERRRGLADSDELLRSLEDRGVSNESGRARESSSIDWRGGVWPVTQEMKGLP